MISGATMKERGPTPRKLQKFVTAAKRQAWLEVGRVFHETMRPKRFTKEHAAAAKYGKRKGENLAEGSKGWKRSTAGRKFKQSQRVRGADAPLVWSGRTRLGTEIANIRGTTKGVKVHYPGANTLNFKHRKSRLNMRKEFVTLTKDEVATLAKIFDNKLDSELAKQGL